MIRINLLPFRAARKKENIKKQISIYVVSILIAMAGMVIYFQKLDKELSGLKEKERAIKTELAKKEKTIKEIAKLKKEIKEVESKLKVIEGLEKGKTGPVHLLDEIAMAVPRDKLWLTALNEARGSLTLTGTAMDNETVSDFMVNLEKSEYIGTVDLQSTRMRNLPEYRLRVSDFTLNCSTVFPTEEEKPKSATSKRGKAGRKKAK